MKFTTHYDRCNCLYKVDGEIFDTDLWRSSTDAQQIAESIHFGIANAVRVYE